MCLIYIFLISLCVLLHSIIAYFFPEVLFILYAIVAVVIFLAIRLDRKERKDDEGIVSAEIVRRKQITRETFTPSGFSIGSRGGGRMYWRVKNVPNHVEVTLNVVYENGKHVQITLVEDSYRYNRIMSQCASRKEIPAKTVAKHVESSTVDRKKPDYIEIQTNQLVAGVYMIGDSIPEGTYDFRWVWGNGCVKKYADQTTKGSNLYVWVGNRYDYESQIIINVVCKSGEYLRIEGNLIVEIRKSKPVHIDL